MSGASDREVYHTFVGMADELDRLASLGVSFAAGAALNTAARSLRGMAAAIYEHSLADDDSDLQ
jgi:hypothetical protein